MWCSLRKGNITVTRNAKTRLMGSRDRCSPELDDSDGHKVSVAIKLPNYVTATKCPSRVLQAAALINSFVSSVLYSRHFFNSSGPEYSWKYRNNETIHFTDSGICQALDWLESSFLPGRGKIVENIWSSHTCAHSSALLSKRFGSLWTCRSFLNSRILEMYYLSTNKET